MSININASVIINNLTANNYYQFSSAKRTTLFDSNADTAKSDASSLKHALRTLKNFDVSEGTGIRTQNKIEDFVNSYNDLISSSSNITNSKKMDKYLKKMDKLLSEYEDSLKDIGITRTASKKLKFDKTNFSEISTEKINAVFGKEEHFVTDGIKYVKLIGTAAEESLNTPVNVLTTTTISVSASNTALAQSGNRLSNVANSLLHTQYTNDNRAALVSYLSQYVTSYNQTQSDTSTASLNSTETDYISRIQSATSNAKDSLSAIGITANADNTLSFDETKASAADVNTIQALFGSTSSYGAAINNYSEKLFASLVKADASGLNINYYA